jgi:hypothetical protein
MPRVCSICQRDDRTEIDEELVAGHSMRAIARRRGTTKDSLNRHKRSHMPVALVAVRQEAESDRALSLSERVERLIGRIERLAESAEQEGHANLLLQASKELRESYRLAGHLSGELRDQPQVALVNLHASPEWVETRTRLLEALERHPAALADVRRALEASNA